MVHKKWDQDERTPCALMPTRAAGAVGVQRFLDQSEPGDRQATALPENLRHIRRGRSSAVTTDRWGWYRQSGTPAPPALHSRTASAISCSQCPSQAARPYADHGKPRDSSFRSGRAPSLCPIRDNLLLRSASAFCIRHFLTDPLASGSVFWRVLQPETVRKLNFQAGKRGSL